MVRQGHLGLFLSPNITLKPWNELLSGLSEKTPTSMVKSQKCNMLIAVPKVLTQLYLPW